VLDALAFALDNPEVMEVDVGREQEILARAGHRERKRATTDAQIELPFAGAPKEPPASR
jgi:hypothetical protein